jgi:hypothetical protein
MSRSQADARFNPTESSFVSRLNRSFATQSPQQQTWQQARKIDAEMRLASE